ncbi:hypothetical protein DFH28DRAFT_1138510 [Melampsora americana]|nr:hypothetical protein DFH28DRAFT_1138510 [Melampsora americana]
MVHPVEKFYPGLLNDTIEVCKLLKEKDVSPKNFMRCYFLADNEYLKYKRRKWGIDEGWPSSLKVIFALRKTVCEQKGGDEKWNDFIFDEAKRIVDSQEPPRGYAPHGSFYSSKSITPDFFSEENNASRDAAIQSSMPFLYKLINSKILASIDTTDNNENQETINSEDIIDDTPGDEDGDMLENVGYTKPKSSTECKMMQSISVPTLICGMVAFVCNRRANGMQIHNAMTFLACGASERLHEFLHFHGLIVSRDTALNVADSLRKEAEKLLKETMAKPFKVEPFLCVDNIDFQERIHTKRVEANSTMFHGSTGYQHLISDSLSENITIEDFSYSNFESAMKAAETSDVQAYDFLPTDKELAHLEAVSKTQISKSYLLYVAVDDNGNPFSKHPDLELKVPEINPIKVEEANIHMLKLMNAADTSAEGVGQLMDQVDKQVGRDPVEHLAKLHIVEGDVGTCMNFESLREKRIPASNLDEGFLNWLTIPGLAHLLWNVMQAIVIHHYNDTTVDFNTGLARAAQELGVKIDNIHSKKDFNLMLHMVHQVHAAEITACLMHILDDKGYGFDHLDTKNAQEVVDECHTQFFTVASLKLAEENGDQVGYNLRLRLRDLGSIVEMDHAMKRGDIGRVMIILKTWSFMSHGVKGMSHYARHIPRLVLLLEHYLPKPVAHVIKHSLLIPASGRDGHFIAKDFYLELQNYWLKYFYNHSGPGTNIKRLTERFSLNIPLNLYIVLVSKSFERHKATFGSKNYSPVSSSSNHKPFDETLPSPSQVISV